MSLSYFSWPSLTNDNRQVNRLNVADLLLDWNVDGIISDYPGQLRNRVEQRGFPVSPVFPKQRVLDCLSRHIQKV